MVCKGERVLVVMADRLPYFIYHWRWRSGCGRSCHWE